jgi:hypothetical protein
MGEEEVAAPCFRSELNELVTFRDSKVNPLRTLKPTMRRGAGGARHATGRSRYERDPQPRPSGEPDPGAE